VQLQYFSDFDDIRRTLNHFFRPDVLETGHDPEPTAPERQIKLSPIDQIVFYRVITLKSIKMKTFLFPLFISVPPPGLDTDPDAPPPHSHGRSPTTP
jgi:hypothetical protein